MQEAIHSKRLQCGAKTYFFDIREAKSSGKYLQITESRPLEEGNRRRTDIAIFAEHLKDFKEILDEMIEKYQNRISE